jgi:hypothetical protein
MTEITNFVLVLVVAVGVATSIAVLYSSGLRLWAAGETDTEAPHLMKRTLSCVCFAMCAAIVLFALWLMIPAFH